MAIRWISLVALGLALSSCSNGGFIGRTGQFSGVWLYEFEGSTFVDGATGIPADRPDYKETDWLEWVEWPILERLMQENSADQSLVDEDCHNPVQPFLVTFVGRRTHHPFGGAGQWGLWPSKVTVHEPISAKVLSPPFCYDR